MNRIAILFVLLCPALHSQSEPPRIVGVCLHADCKVRFAYDLYTMTVLPETVIYQRGDDVMPYPAPEGSKWIHETKYKLWHLVWIKKAGRR